MIINHSCLLAIFFTLAAGSLHAQTTIPLIWDQDSTFTEKNGILSFTEKEAYLSSEPFPVNSGRTYTLSATIRCRRGADNAKSQVFLAFIGVDALNRKIECWRVLPIPGTFTVLKETARKGDRNIKVANARYFISSKPCCLVFNAKADESDIPSSFFMTSDIIRKIQKDDYWRVTLKKRLTRKFNAGTTIRQHARGGYLYPIGAREIGTEWTTCSASIRGVMQQSGWVKNKWPKGTVCGKIIILPNWKGERLETQIRGISLTVK